LNIIDHYSPTKKFTTGEGPGLVLIYNVFPFPLLSLKEDVLKLEKQTAGQNFVRVEIII
jgi:hypothetical protein